VVFIEGEQGSGKSYVLDQLVSTIGAKAVRVDCRAPIGTYNVANIQPLQPFGLAIEQLYQSGEQAARKRLAVNIGMSLLASLPIAGDIFYAIKSVRQDVTEFKRETAALAQKRRAAVDECVDALRAIATHEPFALLVDDAHWSDPQSVEVLARLVADATTPILVVWVYDPGKAREINLPLLSLVHASSSASTIRLSALDEGGFDTVLSAIAPSLNFSSEQRRILRERTAGLPGIMVEYVKYLERIGDVAADGTVKTDGLLATGVQLSNHPATDQMLHELGEEDALFLSICAAEGSEFTAFMVAALTNADVLTTVRRLRQLERSTGLIKSNGVRTRYGVKSTVYSFTSDLAFVFLAHYASYEERRAIHQRIVEVLTNERHQSNVEAVREQLALLIAAHDMAVEGEPKTIQQEAEEAAAVALAGAPPEGEEASAGGAGLLHYSQIIRSACDALVAGDTRTALTLVEQALDAQPFSTSEQVVLHCLAARANMELQQFAAVDAQLDKAAVLAGSNLSDATLILNLRASAAQLSGNPGAARQLFTDAARTAASASLVAQVLTASNLYLMQRNSGESTGQFERLLRNSLGKRHWKELAADLGLTGL
jgi:hypothetical protein